MSEAASIANLANEEWTITNTVHDVVTVDLWLNVALRRHTEDLAGITSQAVPVRYQLDGVDIDADVCAVRAVLDWLHEAYRVAKTYDVTTRPERYALLQRLAESRVMPSEMAVMVGVDVSIAERFVGADDEARIARSILRRLKTA
ncbi:MULTISPECIES: hypothetical protein [unclassified Cryobacterium]|uniref:hypothetical protein n=1 Tax=unclassified Cryobacterium TaxID=2649013 RepID=UPI002AB43BA1|nr:MULTISPECIES: hypothetical protein [unclassified Cryobacterium]MDY7530050.1 hypothetical protein [Cryobacterium sp. 10C2]MDY7555301.1 hypothetical protein [Cryobacterium sp. 10C3]MEB0290605.1 hypothetical protein [Cryobacterium sp. 10C2]